MFRFNSDVDVTWCAAKLSRRCLSSHLPRVGINHSSGIRCMTPCYLRVWLNGGKKLGALSAVLFITVISGSAWGAVLANESPFATELVEAIGYENLPPNDRGTTDPNAVLGKPTRWFKDNFSNYPNDDFIFAASMVVPPFYTDLNDQPVVTTLNEGQSITVAFDHDVLDDPFNPYKIDFIVFGNSFFTGTGNVDPMTDMANYRISLPRNNNGELHIRDEPVTVSVSPDGQQWYTYEDDPNDETKNGPTADGLFPTQAFSWDKEEINWGHELDFTTPVPPDLTLEQLNGLTVAQAIELYEGSAGGTGFDLAESGFDFIRYIRVTGLGAEVDAFADVAPLPFTIPQPHSMLIALFTIAYAMTRRVDVRRGAYIPIPDEITV